VSTATPVGPELLVVSHSGARAGAPMVMLEFLRWLRRRTTVPFEVLLLHGGAMEAEFEEFGAKVVGGRGSRLWMLQHGLSSMGYRRTAGVLANLRLRPALWPLRDVPLVLLNSVGSLPALQFLPGGRRKVVLYVHELDEGFQRTIGPRVWDRLAPRVDHFVSCGDSVTELLVRKGVDRGRITQHHPFIDEPSHEPLRGDYVRRSLGIPSGVPIVGACGRTDWRKAPELFVRLARSVSARRPDLDAHFVWVGGPLDQSPGWQLMHDIDRAGLTGRVHLVGEIIRPDDVFALFDVFTLTSREDPFPLSMLEAATLGVPIVSFRNGGVVELVDAGGDQPVARIVPYLDVEAMTTAVVDLLDDPIARKGLGAGGRDHVLATHLTDVEAPRLLETLTRINPGLAPHRALLGSAAPRSPDPS
jgi:glycosyltransferase involved in cell wall biosynthesis